MNRFPGILRLHEEMRDFVPSREESACSFLATTVDTGNKAIRSVGRSYAASVRRTEGRAIQIVLQIHENRITQFYVLADQRIEICVRPDFLEDYPHAESHEFLQIADGGHRRITNDPAADPCQAVINDGLYRVGAAPQPKLSSESDHIRLIVESAHSRNPFTAS